MCLIYTENKTNDLKWPRWQLCLLATVSLALLLFGLEQLTVQAEASANEQTGTSPM